MYITRLNNLYYNNRNRKIFKKYKQQNRKYIFPQHRRIIVIGDIHGDFAVAIKCLILAKCIESIEIPTQKTIISMNAFFDKLKWIGGDTYIVQLGDQIDRVRPESFDNNNIGNDMGSDFEDEGSTIELFYLFHYLDELAQQHNGRVFSMIGNHEIMNVDGDFRYVSRKEFYCLKKHLNNIYKKPSLRSQTFKNNIKSIKKTYKNNVGLPYGFYERINAFSPAGMLANLMAMRYYTMLQIGNWLFCHGSPTLHVTKTYTIDFINDVVSLYLLGDNDEQVEKHFSNIARNDNNNSILWSRAFGNNITDKHIQLLDKILNNYNITNNNDNNKVMYVAIGHTPQFGQGINAVCDNRVWRCDVGMSKAFQSRQSTIQILEILNGIPRILVDK